MALFIQYKYHHKILREMATYTFLINSLMTTSCEVHIYFARKSLVLLQKCEIRIPQGKQYHVNQVYVVCSIWHF